jgi:hypothetical protein
MCSTDTTLYPPSRPSDRSQTVYSFVSCSDVVLSRSVTSFHRHGRSGPSFYLSFPFIFLSRFTSSEIENSTAESRPIMEGKTKDAQLRDESGLADLMVSILGHFETELEDEKWSQCFRPWRCRGVDKGQNGVKPTPFMDIGYRSRRNGFFSRTISSHISCFRLRNFDRVIERSISMFSGYPMDSHIRSCPATLTRNAGMGFSPFLFSGPPLGIIKY